MTAPTFDPGTDDPAQVQAAGRPDQAARRLRMREFQNRLVDRMQAARVGSSVPAGQLGVLVGETRWLFDLQQAGEIVAAGAMTAVPLTQPWFLGLTNIRGNLISVVDFAHFQGGAPTVIDKQARIVAFAPGLNFNGGLLVSQVLGLRNIADMQVQDTAAGDAEERQGAIERRGARDAQDRRVHTQTFVDRERATWQMLDLGALIRNTRFMQVGA